MLHSLYYWNVCMQHYAYAALQEQLMVMQQELLPWFQQVLQNGRESPTLS